MGAGTGKADVRLPGEGNSNSYGARPVHLIITMIMWIQTSRLSIKKSLSGAGRFGDTAANAGMVVLLDTFAFTFKFLHKYTKSMSLRGVDGTQENVHVSPRLINFCIAPFTSTELGS